LSKLQAEFTKYMGIALKCDAIDFYRSNKNRNKFEYISIETVDELRVSTSLNGGVDTYFFEDEIENPNLKFALSKLTKRQREIFELYVGITETNVTVTISNVKKKLIKLMKG